MKRNISNVWLTLLFLATVLLCGWTVLLFQFARMMLYDSNMAVSKTMTAAQLQHVYATSEGLMRLVFIPMLVLVGMWMLAFACERREHNKLRKQLNQTTADESKMLTDHERQKPT
jgi:hypothetical protein